MVKGNIFYFLLISLFLISCGGEETQKPEPEVIPENIKKTDLTEFEFPFFIYTEKIKDQNGVPFNLEVIHEEAGLDWEIILGNEFNMMIEDWGNEKKNPLAEIQRMEELEQHYEYKYIDKGDNFVLYSKGIPGDAEHVEHHFLYLIEAANNYYYTVKSNPMMEFSLDAAKAMLEASKSITPTQNVVSEA